jgi:selenocysteine lyase/cysteine desulfurase
VPSATIALNLAILGTETRSGDVAYVTPFEHNSVLRPLEHLRKSVGIVTQEMPFHRQTMVCQLDQLSSQFRMNPPKLVCVTQASNVCGLMPPVTEIARLAKAVNPDTIVIVDGAQVAGLYPMALDRGVVDAYIFSGHKSLYGPYGVAGLLLTSDWRPRPILFGGTGTVSERVAMPDALPSAYEPGSHNIWAIAGLNAALAWLRKTGREAIVSHTLDLARGLRNQLSDLDGVVVHTPLEGTSWCGTVSFAIGGVSPQAIETVLAARGIAVRAGIHCAPWMHKWLGTGDLGGTVRVSVGWFNRTQDTDSLLEEIGQMVSGGAM